MNDLNNILFYREYSLIQRVIRYDLIHTSYPLTNVIPLNSFFIGETRFPGRLTCQFRRNMSNSIWLEIPVVESFLRDFLYYLFSELDNYDEVDGVPPITLKKLKQLELFKVSHTLNKEKQNCPICIDTYDVGDECCRLRCNHIFHAKCIKKWLKVRALCPICRNHQL
jgi:hypothetical protein